VSLIKKLLASAEKLPASQANGRRLQGLATPAASLRHRVAHEAQSAGNRSAEEAGPPQKCGISHDLIENKNT
jgi:hypothetical protein